MIDALRDGIRRVNDAPPILLGAWMALLGTSAALGELRPPEPIDPWGEGRLFGVSATHAVVLLFLAGGILDRYARDRATRSFGFFGASGVFFFRLLWLATILGSLAYAVLRRFPSGTAGFALAVAGALALKLLGEYAAVRMVVEDRRSVLGALTGGARFIVAHAAPVVAILLVTLLLTWAVRAAGAIYASASGVGAWSVFAASLLAALVQLWIGLVGWASEISLFQSKLAHAGYVARPQPAWPESPAAEAITASATNTSRRSP